MRDLLSSGIRSCVTFEWIFSSLIFFLCSSLIINVRIELLVRLKILNVRMIFFPLGCVVQCRGRRKKISLIKITCYVALRSANQRRHRSACNSQTLSPKLFAVRQMRCQDEDSTFNVLYFRQRLHKPWSGTPEQCDIQQKPKLMRCQVANLFTSCGVWMCAWVVASGLARAISKSSRLVTHDGLLSTASSFFHLTAHNINPPKKV